MCVVDQETGRRHFKSLAYRNLKENLHEYSARRTRRIHVHVIITTKPIGQELIHYAQVPQLLIGQSSAVSYLIRPL